MTSIWTENIQLPSYPKLEGDMHTDVLIIGGGMAGLLCAYELDKNGVDYVLVEGNTIASGVTRNTTAKITAQHGFLYQKLLKSRGWEIARLYLEANQKAVEKYAEFAREIECDFVRKNNYVYSLDNQKLLEEEADALRRIGYSAIVSAAEELPIQTVGAVGFTRQAQFHPLKFLKGIVKGLNIYEHTFVKGFREKQAVTENGVITFKKVIFATHFPVDNKHGMYFLKMYQHRSYAIALQKAPQLEGMYVDGSGYGLSFRNYERYMIVGGGSHRTGKNGGNWEVLREFTKEHYPNSTECFAWAAQDCMTLDGLPYIGAYSKHIKNCYVATGFNKWGMTSSMVAARLISDLVQEKENPYVEVFNPSRSIWKPQLFINSFEAVANLLTPTKKRCPHLGCALKWNPAEQTWDCPCHGSRFSQEGKVLDNPANGDIKET